MADQETTTTTPVDFRDLLDKPMADFPDRPSLPGGKNFYGKLIAISAGISTQKATPYFQFDVRLTDPGTDVKPTDLEKITAAGFSLSDYDCYSRFYLTPPAFPMLRTFLESLGFSGSTFTEALRLNAQKEPTPESQEAIRGLDVIVRTRDADENGRVYNELNRMAGVKRA